MDKFESIQWNIIQKEKGILKHVPTWREPWKQYAKWKNPDTKCHRLYDSIREMSRTGKSIEIEKISGCQRLVGGGRWLPMVSLFGVVKCSEIRWWWLYNSVKYWNPPNCTCLNGKFYSIRIISPPPQKELHPNKAGILKILGTAATEVLIVHLPQGQESIPPTGFSKYSYNTESAF